MRRAVARNLTVQVLVAVGAAALLGALAPGAARAMKPLGDIFVNLVKMVIGPVVFLTIVLGVAGMRDLRQLGRVGGKALLYFEVVSTAALALGLLVVNVLQPGRGLDPGRLPAGDVSAYAKEGAHLSALETLLHVVPANAVDAFARGDMLQIVFFALLFGVGAAGLGEDGRPLVEVLERLLAVFFRIVAIVMRVAPLGAFGAMAYTIGTFGLGALLPLGRLMLAVYLTMALFIFGVLNAIAWRAGFSLWRLLVHIREEIVLVLGTSSSEPALPPLMRKLEQFGCARPVVGLVVPAGYSFNLDGTSIYLAMAVVFLAQVYRVPLTLPQQLGVLAVLMLTSKGAAGVTGSGFIVLASTLTALRVVPVGAIALLLGVDRFMSEARAITNVIGNAVATVVVARSEGAFHPPATLAAVDAEAA